MTDYSKQLAEELGWQFSFIQLMFEEMADSQDALRQLWAKAVSLLKENAELREHIKIQEEYLRAAHAARDAFEGDVDTLGEQLEEARRDNELFLANVDHFQNKLRSAESSLRVMREQLVHAVSCMNRG